MGAKPIPGKNDFATKYPKIAAEWDYEANGDVKPSDVFSSEKDTKRHWVCKEYGHTWEATVLSRTHNGRGCPDCARLHIAEKIRAKAIEKKGTFAMAHPELLREWDYEKNDPLTPDTIPPSPKEKIWWKCLKKDNHPSYQAYIADKTVKKVGCPICAGKKVLVGDNDLASLRPDIAAEWDYEENDPLTPEMFTEHSSKKKVGWKCSFCGHTWKDTISNRTAVNGTNCKKCSGKLQTSFPEQAIYYYVKQSCPDAVNRYYELFDNGMELDVFIPSYNIGIEYDGIRYHRGRSSSKKEAKKYSICKTHHITLIRVKEAKKKTKGNNNCDHLITIIPRPSAEDLKQAIENLSRFFPVPENIDIRNDLIKIKAGYLSARREGSLASLRPDLAAEWDYEENDPLTPEMFTPGSGESVFWECPVCHGTWRAKIFWRNGGNGCPYCAGKKVFSGFNDLKTRYPEIAKDWDYDNNIIGPDQVMPGTHKSYFWICPECKKAYKRSPHNRVQNHTTLCEKCSNINWANKMWEIRKKSGKITPPNAKAVNQYSLKGEYIATYSSAYEAAEKLKLSRRGISNAANGKQKQCGEFIWKFAETTRS